MWMTEFKQIDLQQKVPLFWGYGVDSEAPQVQPPVNTLTLSTWRYLWYFPQIVGIMTHHGNPFYKFSWNFLKFSPLSSVISLQGWLSRIWLWCWGANMPVSLAYGLGVVQQILNGWNPAQIGGPSVDFWQNDQISHFRAWWLESLLAEVRHAESNALDVMNVMSPQKIDIAGNSSYFRIFPRWRLLRIWPDIVYIVLPVYNAFLMKTLGKLAFNHVDWTFSKKNAPGRL